MTNILVKNVLLQLAISIKRKKNSFVSFLLHRSKSCSVSITVVEDFLGPNKDATLLIIEAKSAKEISGYTNFSDEEEVILKPGTQLRVKDNALRYSGGLNVIHLVEINDDEVKPVKEKPKTDLSSKSGYKGATGKYCIKLFM